MTVGSLDEIISKNEKKRRNLLAAFAKTVDF
jgi:hypothetical protein